MNIGKAIRLELEGMAEDTYRAFTAGLIPGEEHILGVRLPRLREIAKRIVKTDSWQEYLACEPYYFEEIMLQGMIIGAAKLSAEKRLKINNMSGLSHQTQPHLLFLYPIILLFR